MHLVLCARQKIEYVHQKPRKPCISFNQAPNAHKTSLKNQIKGNYIFPLQLYSTPHNTNTQRLSSSEWLKYTKVGENEGKMYLKSVWHEGGWMQRNISRHYFLMIFIKMHIRENYEFELRFLIRIWVWIRTHFEYISFECTAILRHIFVLWQ